MIGMVWAVAFDWADGLVARRIKNRTTTDSKYGGELDILIDIVSYGVAPAILLLSYGKFDSIFLIGAIFLVSTAAIRLSYFSTYGLINGKKYTGLALDNNSLILVSIFLLEGSIGSEIFTIILYFSMITLGILNISEIKMSKLSGNTRNVWLLAIYTLIITAIYGWKFLN
jgi:CDP-diacylglycerol--serine O-phosphatidyltransferase